MKAGNAPDADRSAILVVEDDEAIRRLLVTILEQNDFRCGAAGDAAEARAVLARGGFALMLCDVGLPDESGIELIRDVLPRYPGLAAIMISALDDVSQAEASLNSGALSYIVKPASVNEVLVAVMSALRLRRRDLDIAEELRVSREETIQRLCIAIEAHDPQAGQHLNDMSELCGRIAERLGRGREQCELIRMAGLLHDIGKVAVPDRILTKPGPLTAEERLEMQRHTEVGYRILAGSSSRPLQLAASVAWTHHEWVDGSGYPRGLTNGEIPVEGRIAAVADVFDALTRDRVYRPAFSVETARDMLERERGSHFDPEVLDAFLPLLDESIARA